MLTSLDQLQDKLSAVEIGADGILTKPFDVSELRTRVRSLLSLKRFTDELEHASRILQSIALVVEGRDRYTGDPCQRLGRYAERAGREFELGDDDLGILRLGGSSTTWGRSGSRN